MKNRIYVALILAAAILPGCGYFQRQSSNDLYLKGQLEAQKGNLPTALERLSAAIRANPRLGLAYMARGEIYKKEGNYQAAEADFEQAVHLEPYNFNANRELGKVYQYLKKFAEAIKVYERALEVRPLDPETNMDLAMSYVQEGEPLRGLPYAQRAVQANEDSATGHANLGMLYSQIGYHSAAIDSFKRALELDSHQTEVYANLAQEYLSDKKYDQARNVLETAQKLAPSAKVLDRLGYAYHMLRQEDKAADTFKQALKVDPNFYPSLNGLGVVQMSRALATSTKDIPLAKEAIGYWNQSLAINPNQDAIKQLVNNYAPKE